MIVDTDADYRFNPDTCYIWQRGYKTITELWLWRVELAGGDASAKECAIFYDLLWHMYFNENHDIRDLLYHAGELMISGEIREHGSSPVDAIRQWVTIHRYVRSRDEIQDLL
jgi:hypothetical protein